MIHHCGPSLSKQHTANLQLFVAHSKVCHHQQNRVSTVLSCASAHPRARAHPPILTVLWFVRSSVWLPTMQNSCVVTRKFTVWVHIDCFDEFQAPLHPAARFAHTSRSLVRSVLRLQYKIHARDERCEAMATRLRVGRFSSRIQLLYCCAASFAWKRKHRGSYNASRFICHLPSDPGWALAWAYLAPSLCKGPPTIFRAWAARSHGRLPGTIL